MLSTASHWLTHFSLFTIEVYRVVRSSDLVDLFQEKSFDHASLSNEETIENGETGEDDKAATTEVSSVTTKVNSFYMQADSVNKLTSASMWGDSWFILSSCTLMIDKMKKLLKTMNLIMMIKLVGLRSLSGSLGN